MLGALIGPLIGLVTKTVDKAVPNKDLAAEIKSKLTTGIMEIDMTALEGQIKVILAEAKGGWLQRNWRPGMMVFFAGLVGAHWFGFTPENLSPETISDLMDLVKIGIGGYVVGRSAEKVMKEYKK